MEVLGKKMTDLVRQVVPRQQRLAKARRQEQEGMKRFGGKLNPRSGARPDRKNDGHTAEELVEFKRTDNRWGITLKLRDLRDLEGHALVEGRLPVLVFEIVDQRYVIIPERDYLDRVHRSEQGASRPTQGPDGHAGDHLPGVGRSPEVDGSGQMPRKLRSRRDQPVLRRLPAQRPGPGGEVDLPGNPRGAPRPLPSGRPVSGVRPGPRGEVGGLGRVLRKRTSPDQEAATSCHS